ncbi:OmpA family protein [Streptomyces sp. NPDC059637]|uniref:OmpA family protein n=1 Tax=Streptomyces sp. NPDC059637 TaxID=3347752 RepID=UPI003693D3A0
MNRFSVVAAACAALLLASGLGTGAAFAEDGPGEAKTPPPPVEVDGKDPDLKLPEGATLAEPRVLDIKFVVEAGEEGEERREESNEDTMVALQSEVLFSKDSARLSSEARSRIVGVADEIEEQGARAVRVFGFTDDLGSSAHGDKLSKQRADAVYKVLAKELGPDVRFDVRGYGEDYPIADNSTEEGRKKNRRVEISFPKTRD